MDSIDLITQALHDNKNQDEIDRLFSVQNSALQDKLLALVGPDGWRNIWITRRTWPAPDPAQFAGSLTGDPATVADKKSQLLQAMQQATQSALAAAGLPPITRRCQCLISATSPRKKKARKAPTLGQHLRTGCRERQHFSQRG